MGQPSVTVRIPPPLRKLTGGREEVAGSGATLAALIVDLDSRHAGLRDRLLDAEGRIRKFVNVYVNDEDVRFLKDLETELKEGETVTVVPAIAGGAGGGSRLR
jgi:molybdopterin converting factor small subunit